MDIKRKKKEKRIQLLGGLIGICVAVISLFYFFHAEKAEAEKRMVEVVNYVKVQCSTRGFTSDPAFMGRNLTKAGKSPASAMKSNKSGCGLRILFDKHKYRNGRSSS